MLDFPGVDVQVGSAWVRPLGGLWLRDVKLFRREDPSHPFLIIPSATVYHDKEQMAQGRLVVRKVEPTPAGFPRRPGIARKRPLV